MGLLVSLIENFLGGRSVFGICVVNDWDCLWFGLVPWLLKFWPLSWVWAPLLGLSWPRDWLCPGVNGWGALGSMIGFAGVWDVTDWDMCGQ